MSASDVSPPFHRLFHPPPDTGRWSVVWLFFVLFVCVCGVCVCLFSCFASVRGFFTIPPRVVDLDDRQCFTARSAVR